jgi:hypothetical protein
MLRMPVFLFGGIIYEALRIMLQPGDRLFDGNTQTVPNLWTTDLWTSTEYLQMLACVPYKFCKLTK